MEEVRVRRLVQIYESYRRRLKAAHLVTQSDLMHQATLTLSRGREAISVPDLLLFDGFTDLTPRQVALLNALALKAGETVVTWAVADEDTGTGAFAITVDYTVAGTATAGIDYTALSGTVAMAATQMTATISVAVLDDVDAEVSETVEVTVAACSGYVLGASTTATVPITSEDVAAEAQLFRVFFGATDRLAHPCRSLTRWRDQRDAQTAVSRNQSCQDKDEC